MGVRRLVWSEISGSSVVNGTPGLGEWYSRKL
jgi:hypothetical protein